MSKIYFISGASGSGKTTIIPVLKRSLGDNWLVHDFDDIGVPQNADKKWRQESTEKWLQKLLPTEKNTCLLGQIVLGEILACPSAKKLDIINFCLLDVSDVERIKRLQKRNTYGADQNMLNWSSWLRMHSQYPQWEQHVIKQNSWEKLDFDHWDKLSNWKSKANIALLDTTDFNIEQTTNKITAWLRTL
ncbi:MAG: AAA family ATPase [Epsilonproteobacteria bacterium]|nr:AAA family ATPase [Campylobacterota bacterium]